MNQLIKQDNYLVESKLQPAIQSLVVLRIGHKPVKDIAPNALKRACADILTKASFDGGSPMADDAGILKAQTEALFNELRHFSDFTVPEVTEAFNTGVRGQTGPYFGFCPKTYHQFLKWWKDSSGRGRAWLAYLEELSEEKRSEKPVYYTKENLLKLAMKAFEEFKENGVMPIAGAAASYYDVIKESIGVSTLILISDWPAVQEQAKKEYHSDMSRGKKESDIRKMKLEYVLENKSFEFHIKRVGLKFYFNQLISTGKGLEF